MEIVSADNTIAKEPETQMIGPSQPPVSLKVNIPKTQDNNNNDDSVENVKKHEFAHLFNPKSKILKGKKKIIIVRSSITDQVRNEVHCYLSCVEDQS